MKTQYYKLACIFMLILSACGKTETPSKETPATNPTPNPVTPTSKALFVNDPNFKAPTGFTSGNAALQSDGKIIVDAYSTVNNQTVVKVFRLNSNGTLDNTFNIDVDKTWLIKGISGIFVLADNKVLLCGEFTISGQRSVCARLTTTGALDYAYVQPQVGNPISLRFQRTANGKVLLATTEKTSTIYDYVQARLYRLNSDGSLDSEFNVTTYDVIGTNDGFYCMVPLTSGQIIVSGIFSIGNAATKRQHVARLNADGSVDFSFEFKELPNSGAIISQVTVQSDGKIVIGGNFPGLNDPTIRDANYAYVGLARLSSTGAIDHSFAAPTRFTWSNSLGALTTTSDNKILASWRAISANANFNQSFVEYFGANGGIDNSYTFQYQYSKIQSIFREAPDQFLVLGEIGVEGVNYPVIRIKKQ